MSGYTLVLCQAEGCTRAGCGDRLTAHPADPARSTDARSDPPEAHPAHRTRSADARPDPPGAHSADPAHSTDARPDPPEAHPAPGPPDLPPNPPGPAAPSPNTPSPDTPSLDTPSPRTQPVSTRARGPVEQALSEATRHSEHGIMVVTGCLLGQLLCRTCGPSAPAAAGRVAVVQPCHASRQPSGPAVLVGPIRDTDDATELCHWLRGGTLTSDRLPERLREYARTLRRASAN